MKLPSVQQAAREAWLTFLRFPFVIVDAVVGTIVALILVDFEGPPRPTVLYSVLLAAILGIPLLTALALLAERKQLRSSPALMVQAFGIVLLVGYAATVPPDLTNAPLYHLFRLWLLIVTLLLFVTVSPFLGKGSLNGFWQYNKSMVLRALVALVYSHVLFAGLAFALAAVDQLFGFEVAPKRYPELWIFTLGIVATWIFLAGVPDQLESLDTITEYPKVLKVLAQYILLPLVLVYLVILYAYLVKIVVAWDWPQGWVSRLILGFAATGILTNLLLHPLAGRSEYGWITRTSRWFYLSVLPVTVMLFLALSRRISEYGITEGRYLAVALGVWLLGTSLYFAFSRTANIKAIPVSLALLCLLMSAGPWGMFSVSERNQVGRLETLLTSNSILKEGNVSPAHSELPYGDRKEISAILEYLRQVHGYESIQPWFSESLRQDSLETTSAYKPSSTVAGLLGVKYVEPVHLSTEGSIFLTADTQRSTDVRGYDGMLRDHWIRTTERSKTFPEDGVEYRASETLDTLTVLFLRGGTPIDSVQVDVHATVERLARDYHGDNASNIPPGDMYATGTGDSAKATVCLRHLRFRRDAADLKIEFYGADILYARIVREPAQ